MCLIYIVQGSDREILRDFLHMHTVTMVSSRSLQAMLILFLTCYREVRSCYQLLWLCRTGGLDGDSRLNLLVVVLWCSTRPRRRQSTPSLCAVTAGVATEKPCSLAGTEGPPPPLESFHTWKTQPNICSVILLSLGVITEKPGISRCDCLYYLFIFIFTWKE